MGRAAGDWGNRNRQRRTAAVFGYRGDRQPDACLSIRQWGTPGNDDELPRDGLTLSLQRVCDYDSWKSGLLVPVWNVYCRIEETRTDGDGETIVWSDAHPVLSVQAIDGSVIDLQKGY